MSAVSSSPLFPVPELRTGDQTSDSENRNRMRPTGKPEARVTHGCGIPKPVECSLYFSSLSESLGQQGTDDTGGNRCSFSLQTKFLYRHTDTNACVCTCLQLQRSRSTRLYKTRNQHCVLRKGCRKYSVSSGVFFTASELGKLNTINPFTQIKYF